VLPALTINVAQNDRSQRAAEHWRLSCVSPDHPNRPVM
jgi:hypothetical protein